jgi:hypothetical protein
MPALSLEDQLFVLQGDPINDYDFAKGRAVDIWMASLPFNQDEPTTQSFSVSATAAIAAVALSVTTPALSPSFTIYRNDVIKTAAGKFAIVKETKVIPANVATNIVVFPLAVSIASGDTFVKYIGLTPFFSGKEGAFSSASASYAEAHNKNMGLYAVSQKIREDYTATITGDVAYNDPCLTMLESMKVSGLSKMFVQARYTVAFGIGGSYNGDGVLGEQYRGNVALSMSDTEAGMVGISIEVKISGAREKYVLI